MSKEWKPATTFDVMDIINAEAIKEISVGSSVEQVYSILGEPELPPARLSRKSPIYIHLYGNVSLSAEDGKIITIDIDFHGSRKKMVFTDSIKNWSFENWTELSKKKGWEINLIYDTYSISNLGMTIAVSEKGKIRMLSLQ